jgi:hypothetical protein
VTHLDEGALDARNGGAGSLIQAEAIITDGLSLDGIAGSVIWLGRARRLVGRKPLSKLGGQLPLRATQGTLRVQEALRHRSVSSRWVLNSALRAGAAGMLRTLLQER